MSSFIHKCRGPWRMIPLVLALFVATGPGNAVAHDLLTAYIQHSLRLFIGADQIDVTVDLTFFEEWSAKERLGMDTDGNGRVSSSELDSYAKRLAPRVLQQMKLRAAGREVALAPLYEPEIDLQGNDQVGPAHHRLRLFFFAVSPGKLQPGDEIVVENSLWPKAKALGLSHAEGRDGVRLEATLAGESALAPVPPGAARRFTFRCVKPPPASTNPKPNAE